MSFVRIKTRGVLAAMIAEGEIVKEAELKLAFSASLTI